MIQNGPLTFGDVTVDRQRVIISQTAGTQAFRTDGVIGWNLFGHCSVEIDYDRERILLHDNTTPDSLEASCPGTGPSGHYEHSRRSRTGTRPPRLFGPAGASLVTFRAASPS